MILHTIVISFLFAFGKLKFKGMSLGLYDLGYDLVYDLGYSLNLEYRVNVLDLRFEIIIF